MKAALALLALAALPGCDTPTACCVVQGTLPHPEPPAPEVAYQAVEVPGVAAVPASHVLVLQSTRTNRLTEVIGVVDVHVEMGGHDAALEMLKSRAAQLGADAVVGVEFHHGHGEEEPTHLSGLAVRFVDGLR